MGTLQDGIYYRKGSTPKKSMSILLFKINKTSKASEIGNTINRIWNTCINLKKGILKDFDMKVTYPKLYHELTFLIGYGPEIFKLEGILKKKPKIFSDEFRFANPMWANGSILEDSDLKYDENINQNTINSDDFLIQFISDSPDITNQCVVEIWHDLLNSEQDNEFSNKIAISNYYDGFRRSDNRNWMGFHDGLSNIRTEERMDIIAINSSQVGPEDYWTVNGTFMSFIRMYIDLENWWKKKINEQEIMVGRDKVTGCPLVGVNERTGQNVVVNGCPIPGTREVSEKGNEKFRNHPPYGSQVLPPGISDRRLEFSHIGEMRKITKISSNQFEQYRIFRQGYEFLEKTERSPGFRAGLNFISFQDNPSRLLNLLKNFKIKQSNRVASWRKKNIEIDVQLRLNSYFRIGAAGLYFVPPLNPDEQFPGASIFLKKGDQRKGTSVWKS